MPEQSIVVTDSLVKDVLVGFISKAPFTKGEMEYVMQNYGSEDDLMTYYQFDLKNDQHRYRARYFVRKQIDLEYWLSQTSINKVGSTAWDKIQHEFTTSAKVPLAYVGYIVALDTSNNYNEPIEISAAHTAQTTQGTSIFTPHAEAITPHEQPNTGRNLTEATYESVVTYKGHTERIPATPSSTETRNRGSSFAETMNSLNNPNYTHSRSPHVKQKYYGRHNNTNVRIDASYCLEEDSYSRPHLPSGWLEKDGGGSIAYPNVPYEPAQTPSKKGKGKKHKNNKENYNKENSPTKKEGNKTESDPQGKYSTPRKSRDFNQQQNYNHGSKNYNRKNNRDSQFDYTNRDDTIPTLNTKGRSGKKSFSNMKSQSLDEPFEYSQVRPAPMPYIASMFDQAQTQASWPHSNAADHSGPPHLAPLITTNIAPSLPNQNSGDSFNSAGSPSTFTAPTTAATPYSPALNSFRQPIQPIEPGQPFQHQLQAFEQEQPMQPMQPGPMPYPQPVQHLQHLQETMQPPMHGLTPNNTPLGPPHHHAAPALAHLPPSFVHAHAVAVAASPPLVFASADPSNAEFHVYGVGAWEGDVVIDTTTTANANANANANVNSATAEFERGWGGGGGGGGRGGKQGGRRGRGSRGGRGRGDHSGRGGRGGNRDFSRGNVDAPSAGLAGGGVVADVAAAAAAAKGGNGVVDVADGGAAKGARGDGDAASKVASGDTVKKQKGPLIVNGHEEFFKGDDVYR